MFSKRRKAMFGSHQFLWLLSLCLSTNVCNSQQYRCFGRYGAHDPHRIIGRWAPGTHQHRSRRRRQTSHSLPESGGRVGVASPGIHSARVHQKVPHFSTPPHLVIRSYGWRCIESWSFVGTFFCRYDELWMPLISDLTVGSTPPVILPPVDVKWVWYCHTLNPVSFGWFSGEKALFGCWENMGKENGTLLFLVSSYHLG